MRSSLPDQAKSDFMIERWSGTPRSSNGRSSAVLVSVTLKLIRAKSTEPVNRSAPRADSWRVTGLCLILGSEIWNSRTFPAAETKKGRNRKRLPAQNSKGHSRIYGIGPKKVPQKKKKGSRNPNPLPPFQEVCLTTSSYARSFINVSWKTKPLGGWHPPFSGWFEPLRIPGFFSLGFPG
jgi:hypothetical protein